MPNMGRMIRDMDKAAGRTARAAGEAVAHSKTVDRSVGGAALGRGEKALAARVAAGPRASAGRGVILGGGGRRLEGARVPYLRGGPPSSARGGALLGHRPVHGPPLPMGAGAAWEPPLHGPPIPMGGPSRTSSARWQAAQRKLEAAAGGGGGPASPHYGPAIPLGGPAWRSTKQANMGLGEFGPTAPKQRLGRTRRAGAFAWKHKAMTAGGVGAAAGIGSLMRNTGPGATGNGYRQTGASSGGAGF